MYWEGSGKISKLKKKILQESVLLQPIMIVIILKVWKDAIKFR